MPTLSVASAHDRSIRVDETAVAVRLPGAVGGSVSGGASVVAEAVLEYGPSLFAASTARTRYEYSVDGVRPTSMYVVDVPAAISAKLEQPAPEQRSIRY